MVLKPHHGRLDVRALPEQTPFRQLVLPVRIPSEHRGFGQVAGADELLHLSEELRELLGTVLSLAQQVP